MESESQLRQARWLSTRIYTVVSVGYGLKERGGTISRTPAIRFYVRNKRPLDSLAVTDRIPASTDGVTTDVIEYAPALPAVGRHLAAPERGARIANAKGVPGTLGCFGRRNQDGEQVLLTSWHVLFGAGAGERSRLWTIDVHRGRRRVREIGRSLSGAIGAVSMNGEPYYIDCAIASAPRTRRRLFGAGVRGAPGAAYPGDRVTKLGAATQWTEGIVVDVCYTDLACIENRAFPTPRQLLIRPLDTGHPFSAEGDSGAAVMNSRREVVGLLWGTNCRGEGVACHIQPVLQTLKIGLLAERPSRFRDALARLLRRGGAA